jgi:hypothetical protein
MQPSENSTGEELHIMEGHCERLGFGHSTSLPAHLYGDNSVYGVTYSRNDADRTGHCVVHEKGHYHDYQAENGGKLLLLIMMWRFAHYVLFLEEVSCELRESRTGKASYFWYAESFDFCPTVLV